MNLLEAAKAIALGVIEGLTEFLPVSSTAHLLLASDILGLTVRNFDVFAIVIQLGAILAVCWAFRIRLWDAGLAFLKAQPGGILFVRNIMLAFLPAVVVGVLAHDAVKAALHNPALIALALVAGGVAILAIEHFAPKPDTQSVEAISWQRALLIGLAQCVAMIPGVSRAGATIMGAVLCRVDRRTAAEFSFFLAIPTMVAASCKQLWDYRYSLSADGASIIAIGFVAAFLSALVVVRPFVAFVGRQGFASFAFYRMSLGLAILILLFLGYGKPF